MRGPGKCTVRLTSILSSQAVALASHQVVHVLLAATAAPGHVFMAAAGVVCQLAHGFKLSVALPSEGVAAVEVLQSVGCMGSGCFAKECAPVCPLRGLLSYVARTGSVMGLPIPLCDTHEPNCNTT